MTKTRRVFPARAALALGVWVAYALAFIPLYHLVGSTAASLAMLPAAVTGWLFGIWPGLLAGAGAVLADAILATVVGEAGWVVMFRTGLPGAILLVASGLAIKKLRDSADLVRLELAQREQAEQEMRGSEERFRTLFESAPDAYYLSDLKGNFVDGNEAAERLVGYDREALIGKSFLRLKLLRGSQIPRAAKLLAQNSLGQPTGPDEFTIVRRDGTQVPVEIRTVPVNLSGQRVVLGIARDITERKRAEDEAKRRAAQAALIYQVARRVSTKLELKALLSETVVAIRDAFEHGSVMVLLLDDDGQRLCLQSAAGDYADSFPRDLSLAIGEGMTGHAAATGKTQLSGDAGNDPRYVRKADEKTRSELAAPILSGQSVIGVLDLQSEELYAFTETDVVMAETLAEQIAVAIENARLYESLRRSEERYRAISELTSDWTYSYCVEADGSLTLEWMTDAATRVAGLTADEVRERGWERHIYPEDLHIAERKAKVLLSGQPSAEEYRIVTASGEVRWVRDFGKPVWDDGQGRAVRIYGATQDITQRKRAEEALRESGERYRDLFESSGDLIQNVRPDGHLLYVNPAWRAALGYDDDEIADLSLFDIVHPDCQANCEKIFQRVMSGESIEGIEAVFVAKGGKEISVEGNASCRFEDGRPLYTRGTFHDVTDRKEAQEKLQRTMTNLQRFNRLAVGRELQMIELKREINYLSRLIGREGKYSIPTLASVRNQEEGQM